MKLYELNSILTEKLSTDLKAKYDEIEKLSINK